MGTKKVQYYQAMFTNKKLYKRNILRGSGKSRQVTVDYESGDNNLKYRDFTKYIRADKTTQVQAWYSTDKLNQWNRTQPKKLRAVVSSLRPAK